MMAHHFKKDSESYGFVADSLEDQCYQEVHALGIADFWIVERVRSKQVVDWVFARLNIDVENVPIVLAEHAGRPGNILADL